MAFWGTWKIWWIWIWWGGRKREKISNHYGYYFLHRLSGFSKVCFYWYTIAISIETFTPIQNLKDSFSIFPFNSLEKMSTLQLVESNREKAEVYTDPTLYKIKSKELLAKINLPKGLLPLDDIVEVGYNKSTGFVWLKQKKSIQHKFSMISRNVSCDTDITAFVEDRRMKRLTGVKSKELFIWVTISEIYIQDPNSDKITFGTPTGISRTFPVAAFEEEEEKEEKK